MCSCRLGFITSKFPRRQSPAYGRKHSSRRKQLLFWAVCRLCERDSAGDYSDLGKRCGRLIGLLSLIALIHHSSDAFAENAVTAGALVPNKETVQDGILSRDSWERLPALEGKDYGKPRMRYSDFTTLPSGVQYRDIRIGESSTTPRAGDRVVINWSGYTIGYYGRIFEAKNRVQGGAFGDDREFSRFVLGHGELIPALEEVLLTMHPGGIRQVIVPPEKGYPLDGSDWSHDRVGPKPRTFSGMRALNFVLENKGLVDKTLLFNIELIRIDRPGEHGFETFARR